SYAELFVRFQVTLTYRILNDGEQPGKPDSRRPLCGPKQKAAGTIGRVRPEHARYTSVKLCSPVRLIILCVHGYTVSHERVISMLKNFNMGCPGSWAGFGVISGANGSKPVTLNE